MRLFPADVDNESTSSDFIADKTCAKSAALCACAPSGAVKHSVSVANAPMIAIE